MGRIGHGLQSCQLKAQDVRETYTLPKPVGVGLQRTESTNIGCNQWLSLAKIVLKVPLASRNRSLVSNTNMCGEGITGRLMGFYRIYLESMKRKNQKMRTCNRLDLRNTKDLD
jgi:hypothetical protein